MYLCRRELGARIKWSEQPALRLGKLSGHPPLTVTLRPRRWHRGVATEEVGEWKERDPRRVLESSRETHGERRDGRSHSLPVCSASSSANGGDDPPN